MRNLIAILALSLVATAAYAGGDCAASKTADKVDAKATCPHSDNAMAKADAKASCDKMKAECDKTKASCDKSMAECDKAKASCDKSKASCDKSMAACDKAKADCAKSTAMKAGACCPTKALASADEKKCDKKDCCPTDGSKCEKECCKDKEKKAADASAKIEPVAAK